MTDTTGGGAARHERPGEPSAEVGGPDYRYPRERLSGILAHAERRRAETVERLWAAIRALTSQGRPIGADTIFEVSGLRYSSYSRNPEARALFRAHSTFLNRKRRQKKRRRGGGAAGFDIGPIGTLSISAQMC